MNKQIVLISTLSGALAVVFGAFGAHALKDLLSQDALENWKIAVNYQFIHTLALLFLSTMPPKPQLRSAAWCFALGIVCFSGSLYLLSLRDVINISVSFLGPVTPIGGLLFILGWIFTLISAFKNK